MKAHNRSMKNDVNIFQWNCRSISTNLDYLKHQLVSSDYDVLILQSLNVTSNNLPSLRGYYYPPLYDSAHSTEKVHTAIYIREDLEYNPCEYHVDKNDVDIHTCSATIRFKESFTLNVMSVYLPRGPNEKNTEWLRNIGDQNGKWLIGGDFNAHSPFWEKHCKTVTSNRLVENIVDSSLYLLNNGNITRIPDICKHRATAIDLSLVSPDLVPLASWETLEDTLGSDHLPIIICFKDKQRSLNDDINDDFIPKFNYKKADWDKFQNILAAQDFDKDINNNVNDMYEAFKKILLKAADLSIPRKKGNQTSNIKKYNGNVWWNDTCEKAVMNKKEKYKSYIKDKTKERFAEMKKAKNYCNMIINREKTEYWNSFCTKEVTGHKDLNKIWKKISDIKNCTRSPNYPLKIGNNKFLSAKEKAETFVDVFSKNSRYEGLSSHCKKHREKEESQFIYTDPTPQNDIYINAPITITEIKNAISATKNTKCSVGIDIISNAMIKHLPENAMTYLHILFQNCWEIGVIPQIWKDSIVIPILKAGKTNNTTSSYRPIALTSHTGKLFERVVLNRLLHYCEKNAVIPINQSGFRKGRCTIEHLVKLSTQVKRQFARRKSILATFFDVSKAYDQVWHRRLLYKLKNIGLSGHMYDYIKCFLSNRTMQTRIGATYSTSRTLNMGIPQGSVIAPILFNILIYDLPKAMSKNVSIVQYADDICMWMNVTLKKSTPQRTQKYIKRLYQYDLDCIGQYMLQNGLSLSSEKTNMMLFNSGSNPQKLPAFTLLGDSLEYKQSVKFLGLVFTSKLTWNLHFDYILTKAVKSLNLVKVISRLPWGKDTETLKHLATTIVRSKLTYGQEVYFSAPKYLLKKIESIDCKAYKLALGLPSHASNIETYRESGVLPLDKYRELATSKFLVRTYTHENYIRDELNFKSDSDFPKRANSISSQVTIATYTAHLLESSNINVQSIHIKPSYSPLPLWETPKIFFDINYIKSKKDENINITTSLAKTHIHERYQNHLQVFTDGSVLNDNNVGAAFAIPTLKVERSFYLGSNLSIFTAELAGIMMALEYILSLPMTILRIVMLVDSQSVLQSLDSFNVNTRPDLMYEIYYLLYCLSLKGTSIDFSWIPSHCGIKGNEMADRAARKGAKRSDRFLDLNIPKSSDDYYTILEKTAWKIFYTNIEGRPILKKKSPLTFVKEKLSNSHLHYFRLVTSLIFRIRTNSLKTKFSKNANCICGRRISLGHILFNCQDIRTFLPHTFKSSVSSEEDLQNKLNDPEVVTDLVEALLRSPIAGLL